MSIETSDFDFVVQTIEKNYAGFTSKINEHKQNEFAFLTTSLRDLFLNTEDPQLREELLNNFLACRRFSNDCL